MSPVRTVIVRRLASGVKHQVGIYELQSQPPKTKYTLFGPAIHKQVKYAIKVLIGGYFVSMGWAESICAILTGKLDSWIVS